MLTLSPVSVVDVHVSTRNHNWFFGQLSTLIADFLRTTDSAPDHNLERRILRGLDTLLSYGLYSGNHDYWRIVKVLLPKAEIEILTNDWCPRFGSLSPTSSNNGRELAVAWLKDSLNRCLFRYQLKVLLAKPQDLNRFYHRHSLMRNSAHIRQLLESRLLAFDDRPFHFQKPADSLNDSFQWAELSPQTVIISRESPSTAPAKSRLISFCDAEETDPELAQTPVQQEHLPPSDLFERGARTALEEDAILNEMVKKERQRSHVDDMGRSPVEGDEGSSSSPLVVRFLTSSSGRRKRDRHTSLMVDMPTPNTSEHSGTPTNTQVCMDEVLRKSLSTAGLRLLDVAPQTVPEAKSPPTSAEGGSVPKKSVQEDDPAFELPAEGIIELSSSEAAQLSIGVLFEANNERVQQAFHVYASAAAASESSRLLVVSDRYLYVLSRKELTEDSDPNRTASFIIHSAMPLNNAAYISRTLDGQTLTILSLSEDTPSFRVDVCSSKLCAAITQAIQRAHSNLTKSDLLEVGADVEHSLAISRIACDRTSDGGPDADEVQFYGLVQQRESTPSDIWSTELAGYAHLRMLGEGSSLGTGYFWNSASAQTSQWTQSYCLVKGKHFYVFSDSQQKFCALMLYFDDDSEVSDSDQNVKKDSQWRELSLILTTRNEQGRTVRTQLSFSTKTEMRQWHTRILETIAAEPLHKEVSVGSLIFSTRHLLLVQEGERVREDGFVRVLRVVRWTNVKRAAVYRYDVMSASTDSESFAIAYRLVVFEIEETSSSSNVRQVTDEDRLRFLWIWPRDESELQRLLSVATKLAPQLVVGSLDAPDALTPAHMAGHARTQARSVGDAWHVAQLRVDHFRTDRQERNTTNAMTTLQQQQHHRRSRTTTFEGERD